MWVFYRMKKRVLWYYLWEHRYYGAVFLIFILVFAGIFKLYNVKTEPVWYAAVLFFIPACLCIILHFLHYRRLHQERQLLQKHILILTQDLPKPHTLAEADYQEIVQTLQRAYRSSTAQYQSAREDGIDYYTTWVHQIKTPISVMRMLLNEEDTEENRMLSAELFRIEQYVEMALCYIRLDNSTSDFVFEQVSLDPLIRAAVRKYAPQFIQKKIKLEYIPTKQIVLTDQKWLSFILEQLLSNAVKYTECGKVTITVTPDQMLCVSDTGIGIASEDIPRIFEKGFTGYNGRSDKKSTGLGLYLSKKAADKLMHTISVTSTVGKGSTFSIDLKRDALEVE